MGIVNAGADSFSDAVRLDTLERQVARGLELVAEGADLVDVGAESGVTYTPAAPAEEEAARVVPLVERLAAEGVSVSVDTWKPEVARAALDAGAVDAQRRQRAARPRAGRARGAHGRGARRHAHARGAQAARRSPTTTTSRPTSRPSCASGSTLALRARRRRRADRARPRPRLRQDAARRPSRSCATSIACARSGARCCWRSRASTSSARSPGARRPSAWRARWPPRRGPSTRGPRSCACTTSPPCATRWRSRPSSRAATRCRPFDADDEELKWIRADR